MFMIPPQDRSKSVDDIQNRAALSKVIGKWMVSHGFHCEKDHWFMEFPELTHVANLRKSQWGGQFELFLGVWVKSFGSERSPRVWKCDYQAQLEDLVPDRRAAYSLLDLEEQWQGPRPRSATIVEHLDRWVGPWLQKTASLENIKANIVSGQLSKAWLTLRLKALLGMTEN